jgi:hypothetical protein
MITYSRPGHVVPLASCRLLTNLQQKSDPACGLVGHRLAISGTLRSLKTLLETVHPAITIAMVPTSRATEEKDNRIATWGADAALLLTSIDSVDVPPSM